MKELSIEEKAKRYDEAIKVAADIKAGTATYIKNGTPVIDAIFPELKESEDERVKEELKEVLGECLNVRPQIVEEKQYIRFLAWLEKQGEKTSDKIVERARTEKQKVLVTESDGVANIDWDTRSLQDAKILMEYGLNYIKKKLEKQGEPKSADKVEPKSADKVEPKSADKVEPKFREGDWVVYCNDDVDFITGIEENGYCINNGGYIPFMCSSDIRLWTIEDAKDGDVLVNESGLLFIYNGYLEEKQWPFAHGGINIYDRFAACGGLLPFTHEKVIPATKEQRDQLEKAMADAGYTFDFEKKELKKIEQNPAEEYNIAGIGSKNAQGKLGQIIKKLKPVNEVLEQKPWSEEDEKKQNYFIALLQNSTMNNPALRSVNEGLEEWLKSLRPHSQWKPSDEQIKAVRLARAFVTDDFDDNPTLSEILIELEKQLKKLREE